MLAAKLYTKCEFQLEINLSWFLLCTVLYTSFHIHLSYCLWGFINNKTGRCGYVGSYHHKEILSSQTLCLCMAQHTSIRNSSGNKLNENISQSRMNTDSKLPKQNVNINYLQSNFVYEEFIFIQENNSN